MTRRTGLAIFLMAALCARAEPPLATSEYDELLYRALRYGNTEQRRKEKEEARQELFAHGADALQQVMTRVHVENIMLQVLAFEMVAERVPAEAGTPVLAESLVSTNEQTRRISAYFLGFYPRSDAQIPMLLSMLDSEKERNAALRTLGKWRVDEARGPTREFLHASSERTRIAACNALYEIRNPADLSALIEALGDSALLVRNAAARAILQQGKSAKRPLKKALAASEGLQKRQIVRLLGALKAAPTWKVKRIQQSPDPGLREDAVWALRRDSAEWSWEEPYY